MNWNKIFYVLESDTAAVLVERPTEKDARFYEVFVKSTAKELVTRVQHFTIGKFKKVVKETDGQTGETIEKEKNVTGPIKTKGVFTRATRSMHGEGAALGWIYNTASAERDLATFELQRTSMGLIDTAVQYADKAHEAIANATN